MRHFTVEEANGMLGRVRPIVERMVAHRQDVVRRQEELGELRRAVAGNGGRVDGGRAKRLEEELARSLDDLGRCVEEIAALGALVKDLDRGLVDFPACHPADGATVLLCWHLGEDEIRYWHGLEEGFAGRKPLPF